MPELELPPSPPQDQPSRLVVLSPYPTTTESGLDLAGMLVAAWKNRVLLIASWVILTTGAFALLHTFDKVAVSTVIQSGQADGALQTPDQIRNQITEIIFPHEVRARETAQYRSLAPIIRVDPIRNSDFLLVAVSEPGATEEALTPLLEQTLQAWTQEQTNRLTIQEKLIRERMALIESEMKVTENYVKNLMNPPGATLQQAEADRLRLRIETLKQAIFNLDSSLAALTPPFVRKPLEAAEIRLVSGIRGIGICAMLGAILACGFVYAVNIVRVARQRLHRG